MTNFDTISAITVNIKKALDMLDLRFTNKAYADVASIPAAMLPLGRIIYTAEVFEDAYGQKPGYAEADFLIKVVFSEKESDEGLSRRQKLAHGIKEALTVEALNSNALLTARPVSRVNIQRIDLESKGDFATLSCRAIVRYRRV